VAGDTFCSLREAVQASRNTAGTDCGAAGGMDLDTIQLQKGQTYVLTDALGTLITGDFGPASPVGPTAIVCSPNCSDAAGQFATIQGPTNDTVLAAVGGELTVELVRLTGGTQGLNAAGTATVTLDSVLIDGNDNTVGSGGIYSQAVLDINDSIIRDNTASSNSFAGGITNAGSGILTITGTTIEDNTGGYGGVQNTAGQLAITGGVIQNNHANSGGGGIAVVSGGPITITGAQILNNTAATLGGGIWAQAAVSIDLASITGNTAGTSGGGIYAVDDLAIDRTLIGNNHATAQNGGGLNLTGAATVNRSNIHANTAGVDGAGVYLSGTSVGVITNTTLSSNDATNRGGGLFSSGNATLANVTISGNNADNTGGAVAITAGTSTLTNVTVADNTGGTTDGLYRSGGSSTLFNTIVDSGPSNCSGGFNSGGHNLESENDCGFAAPGDIPNGNADLEPLGFPLFFIFGRMHVLGSASEAVDAGDDAKCSAPYVSTKDQRGQTRPKDGNGDSVAVCDIGAYEAPPGTIPTPVPTPSPTPSPTPTGSTPTPTGVTATTTATVTPTGSSTISPTASGHVTPTDSGIATPTGTTAPPSDPSSTTPTAAPTGPSGPRQGDMICDGNINEADFMAYLGFFAGLDDELLRNCPFPLGEELFLGVFWGDVNCDLVLDVLDVLTILLFLADLDTDVAPDCIPLGDRIGS
jgi:predicted outer membrane repeat protein